MSNVLTFPKMKPVPFIRAFPSGEKRLQEIERPSEIFGLACKFIAHGGQYLIAIMSAEEVRLVAAMMSNETEPQAIEVAACTATNGPDLIDAVDRLIRESVEKLDSVQ